MQKQQRIKIRSHPESHIVELEDGSRWQIFPGDLDRTLIRQPETKLTLVQLDDDVSSFSLVRTPDGNRVGAIPEGHQWHVNETKAVLKQCQWPSPR
jgi:hypothetical protein